MGDAVLTPETWVMIVSIVASMVTLIGFGASIWFFLSGSKLQRQAQDALTRIEALASAINERTGDQFSRLVDAVSRAREQVTATIDQSTANPAKVKETFDQLSKEVQKAAASQVVERPKSFAAWATEREMMNRVKDSAREQSRREWINQKRHSEQEQRREIQALMDLMRDTGPLTPDELAQLSPVPIQALEAMGLIRFEKGRWLARDGAKP